MTAPEEEEPGQYATAEEIEDLEATAEDQENVAGGSTPYTIKVVQDRSF